MSTCSVLEPTISVLTVLADGAKHLTRIGQDLARLASGRETRLDQPALARLVDQLVKQALIEPDRWELFGGWLLLYYGITARGISELQARIDADPSLPGCPLKRLGRLVV